MKIINGIAINEEISTGEITQHIGKTIRIHGSIYKIRKMKGFAFVLLRTDRSVIQCIYNKDVSNFDISDIKEESCIRAEALVKQEERSKTGWELTLLNVTILSEPIEGLPIVINQKIVDTSIGNLLDFRPITLRNERERALFKLQEGICNGFRKFLQDNRFTEIHTPKIVYAGAEGGANIFHLDYFGKEAFLAQSPQFYKQMMVGVYERVFEIAPVFRAEKHDTSRHLNEYTSVDFEMGYIESFEDIMQMEVRMLKAALDELNGNYQAELELLAVRLPEINDIPAIRFHEAKEMIAACYAREIRDMEDFEPEEEKLLSEMMLKRTGSEFVFVTHYPSKKRPFYAMDDKDNQEVTVSFDLLFRGVEITTGGQRIHNYHEQLEKMERRNMQPGEFESYLMMHKYGMPPHGGLGLGLERFLSRLLNQDNVRYSCLFPRDINRVTP